ncbi:MAG: hypothetical protein KBS41_01975 [Oscillospiraceae bacterium]|nr:hypothetical protein [Candidatus Equicaccousia limihippi]
MNNLKYYDDSLAYNFELFMPAQKKEAEVISMPQKRKKTSSKSRTKSKKISPSVKRVAIVAVTVTALCLMLFLRSQEGETQSKIVEADKAIAKAKSEETRLNVALEKMYSYQNLEQKASSLGMSKPNKNQIVYIKCNTQNKAVTKNGECFAENN